MKTCAKCSTQKPLDQFNKNARSKDGHTSYCKPCALAVVGAWRRANPEKRAANQKRYYEKQPEKLAAARRRHKERYPEYHYWKNRGYRLARYGFTPESFQAALEDQNNSCAICELSFSEDRQPVIDHCHATGETRSILCTSCNVGLGHIEKPGFLDKAIEYLNSHRRKG